MSLIISPGFTQRWSDWTTWKSMRAAKYLNTQCDDDGTRYTIFGYDGNDIHLCVIYKGNVPTNVQDNGYSQSQNDSDKSDFETNFKPWANGQNESKTADGRLEMRYTTAKRTTNFNLRPISFYTARSGSVHNVNPTNGQDWGDVTYTMYDASGSVVSDPTLSGTVVKTVMDWMPHYNYEIVGGYADIPTALKDGTTDQWYIGGVGLPDIPAIYSGSIPYISEVNLEAVTAQRVNSDGRAISYLPFNYNGQPTNKLRFYIKHPAGAQMRFQFYIEHFV